MKKYTYKSFAWYFATNAFNNNTALDEMLNDGWEVVRNLGATNKRHDPNAGDRSAAVTFVVLRKESPDPVAASSYADTPYGHLTEGVNH